MEAVREAAIRELDLIVQCSTLCQEQQALIKMIEDKWINIINLSLMDSINRVYLTGGFTEPYANEVVTNAKRFGINQLSCSHY